MKTDREKQEVIEVYRARIKSGESEYQVIKDICEVEGISVKTLKKWIKKD